LGELKLAIPIIYNLAAEIFMWTGSLEGGMVRQK
jgi:hypothetical protein